MGGPAPDFTATDSDGVPVSLAALRGKVVVENGEYKGSLNDGKWQHRKVAEEMITAPRL